MTKKKHWLLSSALALFSTLAAITSLTQNAHAAGSTCSAPWIFFDLGDTLIYSHSGKFRPHQNARQYLADLKAQGYHLGLIVNIPESWGKDGEAKLASLKKQVTDLWNDALPFDWSIFDAGILLPPTDKERKPNPYLFDRAVSLARASGCEAVYQGETPDEIIAAQKAGMRAFQIGEAHRFFLPLGLIPHYSGEQRVAPPNRLAD